MDLNTINALIETEIPFEVRVNKIKLCHRLGFCRPKKMFLIRPIKLGCLLNVAELISKLSQPDEKDLHGNALEPFVKSVMENTKLLSEIVARVIINEELSVNLFVKAWQKAKIKRISSFVRKNTTSKELYQLMQLVIEKMDVTHFFMMAAQITGMNLAAQSGEA